MNTLYQMPMNLEVLNQMETKIPEGEDHNTDKRLTPQTNSTTLFQGNPTNPTSKLQPDKVTPVRETTQAEEEFK